MSYGPKQRRWVSKQPLRGQMNVSSYHFSHLSVFSPHCPHLQFRPTLETPHTNLKHSCLSQHFKWPLKSHQFTLRHKCTSGTPQSFYLPKRDSRSFPTHNVDQDTKSSSSSSLWDSKEFWLFQLTINFLCLLRMYNKNNCICIMKVSMKRKLQQSFLPNCDISEQNASQTRKKLSVGHDFVHQELIVLLFVILESVLFSLLVSWWLRGYDND